MYTLYILSLGILNLDLGEVFPPSDHIAEVRLGIPNACKLKSICNYSPNTAIQDSGLVFPDLVEL